MVFDSVLRFPETWYLLGYLGAGTDAIFDRCFAKSDSLPISFMVSAASYCLVSLEPQLF